MLLYMVLSVVLGIGGRGGEKNADEYKPCDLTINFETNL